MQSVQLVDEQHIQLQRMGAPVGSIAQLDCVSLQAGSSDRRSDLRNRMISGAFMQPGVGSSSLLFVQSPTGLGNTCPCLMQTNWTIQQEFKPPCVVLTIVDLSISFRRLPLILHSSRRMQLVPLFLTNLPFHEFIKHFNHDLGFIIE